MQAQNIAGGWVLMVASIIVTIAASRLGAADAPQSLVMLHGIYGRGRNWQAIAKSVVASRPDYACWLVDLPRHGESGPGMHGDSVRGFAQDLRDWCEAQEVAPRAILGHSFGGKVALAWAELQTARALDVWVIDSTPEPKPAGGSAWEMLRLIQSLPKSFQSREDAAQAIADGGYSRGIAVWMSTNLVRSGDAFVWRLDFPVMEALLDDFFSTNLWSCVEHHAPAHTLHFVKASISSAMSEDAAARIESLHDARVVLHRREGTHWIHSESPQVVIDLLVSHLP